MTSQYGVGVASVRMRDFILLHLHLHLHLTGTDVTSRRSYDASAKHLEQGPLRPGTASQEEVAPGFSLAAVAPKAPRLSAANLRGGVWGKRERVGQPGSTARHGAGNSLTTIRIVLRLSPRLLATFTLCSHGISPQLSSNDRVLRRLRPSLRAQQTSASQSYLPHKTKESHKMPIVGILLSLATGT